MEERFDEAEIQALKDFMEVAVQLKKSGILGMLKEALSSPDEAMAGIQADTSLLRLGVLLGAFLEAARRLEGEKIEKLKLNTEDASFCLLNGLASTSPSEAKPRGGLLSLMGALGDPDIQKGLGYLLELAKNLGACMRKMEKKK
ncbi:MAG: DUF1641 domain-containing protein [Fervidicoccaceae archaeon]|jgi:uncharacterized protein YjgD (DUF1641 family)|uniref:DUF1641 domain-containing protein n=1 Tax=Fervidicoccus fontis TaxID=683846 RepID=A0A7C2YHR1_9CREN|nr:MAG: hypothetical protein C0179_02505 [Fervidicoccus sp.]HEU97917.1 DUF1641 domain-containing protein [Fervidicoccus fontis]